MKVFILKQQNNLFVLLEYLLNNLREDRVTPVIIARSTPQFECIKLNIFNLLFK